MDKKKINKDYLDKIKLLEEYNKNYYDRDNPIVSDQEYDSLKKKIIDLENYHKFLNNKQSPTKTVGFKPSKNFKKVKHHRNKAYSYMSSSGGNQVNGLPSVCHS